VVPALQKRMIKLARAHDKVVITATQMMESMITNPVPTRAEVSDVANAVLDGTDAVMLSAETAAGKYPLETVVEMAKICLAAEAAEEFELDADFSGQTFNRIDQSIAMGALFTAHHLNAKGIVALTESGSTALWMSRHRVNPHLCIDHQAQLAAQNGALSQCASLANGHQCRPRYSFGASRKAFENSRHCVFGRHLRHHLW
jgi:pyruvate kinase